MDFITLQAAIDSQMPAKDLPGPGAYDAEAELGNHEQEPKQ